MNFKQFEENCQSLQSFYDESIGRTHNRDSFFHGVRDVSRYLTFVFYKMNLRGQHILFAHFSCDAIALWCVIYSEPWQALLFWLLGHVLDNCDGDLARIRGETDPKWGEIDIHLHLIMNMLFWIVIGDTQIVMVILASRVVMEALRQGLRYSDRYGERSRLWKLAVLPTNVNMMYLSYVLFYYSGLVEVYLLLYAIYFIGASIGQSVKWMVKR